MADHTDADTQALARQGSLYRRLWHCVSPYRKYLFFSLIGYAVYSLGVVLLADLMQYLLDGLNQQPTPSIGLVSALGEYFYPVDNLDSLARVQRVVPIAVVALVLFRGMGFFSGNFFMQFANRGLMHDLRRQYFRVLLHAPAAYFEQNGQGELTAKLTFHIEQLAAAFTAALRTVLREGLVVLGLLSYLLYLNWQLCLVFIAVVPPVALIVSRVGKRFRRYSEGIQQSMGDVSQIAGESIAGYREIRLFDAKARQASRFDHASKENRRQGVKLALVESLSTPVVQVLLALAIAALIWFALQPAVLAGLSAGALVAFLVAAVQLGKPVRQLTAVQSDLQRGLVAAQELFRQLDTAPELDEGKRVAENIQGNIEFRTVNFSYSKGQGDVLQGISLRLQPGELVAVVGPSGSGKSTLLHLLARLYEAPPRSIFIDSHAIEHYQLDSLRSQISLVTQAPVLFADSVRNNLVVDGADEISDEVIVEVLRACDAWTFVNALPGGLDAQLVDRGENLSGGQRQKLAIARAILKQAPILLLDEPTSAFDYDSEYQLYRGLQPYLENSTTLIVAHRLSTVERADKIVVLNHGRIDAAGTHDELIAQNGLYAQLYRRRFAS